MFLLWMPWQPALAKLPFGFTTAHIRVHAARSGRAALAMAVPAVVSAAATTAPVARAGHTATLLPGGEVMVAGGYGNVAHGLSSTEFFDEQYGYWSFGPSMTQPRVFARATLLADGDLLMSGGDQVYAAPATATAELYTPTLLSVNPASGPLGAQVTVSGSGFYAGESVRLRWDGVSVLGHATTTASGTFTTKITIPQAAAGAHQISAEGRRSFAGATTTFTVTG